MEKPTKQQKTLSKDEIVDIQDQILNVFVSRGSVGALAMLNILKYVDAPSVYAICGPYNKTIHAFCKHHQIWKAYAREVLGERLFQEHERLIINTFGCVNYRWMMFAHECTKRLEHETIVFQWRNFGETKDTVALKLHYSAVPMDFYNKFSNFLTLTADDQRLFEKIDVSQFKIEYGWEFNVNMKTERAVSHDDVMKIIYDIINNGGEWVEYNEVYQKPGIREEMSSIRDSACSELERRRKKAEFQRENDALLRKLSKNPERASEILKQRADLVRKYKKEYLEEYGCTLDISEEFPAELNKNFVQFAL